MRSAHQYGDMMNGCAPTIAGVWRGGLLEGRVVVDGDAERRRLKRMRGDEAISSGVGQHDQFGSNTLDGYYCVLPATQVPIRWYSSGTYNSRRASFVFSSFHHLYRGINQDCSTHAATIQLCKPCATQVEASPMAACTSRWQHIRGCRLSAVNFLTLFYPVVFFSFHLKPSAQSSRLGSGVNGASLYSFTLASPSRYRSHDECSVGTSVLILSR